MGRFLFPSNQYCSLSIVKSVYCFMPAFLQYTLRAIPSSTRSPAHMYLGGGEGEGEVMRWGEGEGGRRGEGGRKGG